MAQEANLDLVEISGRSAPPVCKIMSLSKHLFELTKRRSQAKKNQRNSQLKEIKIRPNTGEGDYKVKLKKIIESIESGDKVKVTLRFKGREVVYQELGHQVMDRICDELRGKITVEQPSTLEGKQLIMLIGPKKQKN